jgi:FkbM family methyltransferase
MQSIAQLIGLAGRQAKRISGPVLIYGAGNAGRSVCQFLEQHSIEVLCFIDRSHSSGHTVLGKSVISMEEAHSQYGGAIEVLVAIHNRGVDMPPLLATLSDAGFKNIFTMFDFVNQFPKEPTFRFFLSEASSITGEGDAAQSFLALLEDERSQKIYSNLIKFRTSGDYQFSPLPDVENQYAPKDIPPWNSSLRLIDCGAYNGDSILMFKKYGYQLESILAFEPDLANYKMLVENMQGESGIFLPCGVSSCAKTVRFSAGDGEASRATDAGGISVQMLSIDDAFPDWAPNLIKFDVEGGEYDALVGAQKTLEKYRPGLAISAYHLPSDLWRLGLLIHKMQLNYRFYMRSHAFSSFDTVLYALPK